MAYNKCIIAIIRHTCKFVLWKSSESNSLFVLVRAAIRRSVTIDQPIICSAGLSNNIKNYKARMANSVFHRPFFILAAIWDFTPGDSITCLILLFIPEVVF